jgi:16S rRNA G1207 methylase RsmC
MRKIGLQLPDGPAVMSHRPGIKEPDAANIAVFTALRTIQADQVFVTGPGSIPTAVWAARSGAAVTIWTENANYAGCVEETFRINQLPEPTLVLQAGFESVPTESFSIAIVHLPRGKILQAQILHLSLAVLKQDGKLVFVGAKKEGVKSALKAVKQLFQYAGIVVQKGGYHAGFAQRPSGTYPLPVIHFEQHELSVKGKTTYLVSCPGVFAAGRLDDGAKALIDSMVIEPGTPVLDLGCGSGLVGLSAVRMGADVTMTDVSARAVESTRKTLKANGVAARVLHASGATSCKDGEFKVVYVNPPFHKGHGVDYETTRYLMDEAARVLKPGGKIYLVANAFLKYGSIIDKLFSNTRIHYENRQFRVWTGIKRERPI